MLTWDLHNAPLAWIWGDNTTELSPIYNKNMRQCGDVKTLFMSDEEKHGWNFDLPLLFNIS